MFAKLATQLPGAAMKGKAAVCKRRVREGVACNAFPIPLVDFFKMEAKEVELEGVLHVSALQAHTCLQDFKDLEVLAAPSLSGHVTRDSVLEVLQQAASRINNGISSDSSAHMAQIALCLATPEDTVQEASPAGTSSISRGFSAPTQRIFRPAMSTSSTFTSSSGISGGGSAMLRAPATAECAEAGARAMLLQEELALLEYAGATAWHLSEAGGCQYTQNVMRTATAVRRRRRRALVRALRAGRDAVSSVVSSLDGDSSLDDGDA